MMIEFLKFWAIAISLVLGFIAIAAFLKWLENASDDALSILLAITIFLALTALFGFVLWKNFG